MPSPPQAAATRVSGYDIARAFAVLGMVLVNYKLVMGAEGSGPRWLEAAVGFIDSKAAATFVVLAGVGISLLTRKARETRDPAQRRQARTGLLKRAAFLLVVGLAYTPIWPADILHFYGVYLSVAVVALFWPDRALWGATVGANLVFWALLVGFDYERGWDWTTLEYLDLWTPQGMVRHLFFNGFHPVFPWIGFLLVGMWLGRRDLREQQLRRKVLRIGLLLLVGGTAVSAGLAWSTDSLGAEDAQVLFGTAPLPPLPLYIVVGLGAAFTVISLSIEIGLRFSGQWWVRALTATGQLALTLYVAHVVLGMGLLEAVGRLYHQTMLFAVGAALAFTLLGTTSAWAWRSRLQRGPLEALMRRVTG